MNLHIEVDGLPDGRLFADTTKSNLAPPPSSAETLRHIAGSLQGEEPARAIFATILLEAAADLDSLKRDAARYRWLRDGNAYAPEESFVTGGEELDELCDEGIERASKRGATA